MARAIFSIQIHARVYVQKLWKTVQTSGVIVQSFQIHVRKDENILL